MEVGRVTTIDGVEIAFDVEGRGRDVVWIHGICEHRGVWDPITCDLASEMRSICIDLRGHGESDHPDDYVFDGYVADLRAVLDRVCTSPPLVVGHSLGGGVATMAAILGQVGPVVCVDQTMRADHLVDVIHELAPRLRDPAQYADALMEEKHALGMALVPEPWYSELERLTRTSDPNVVLGTWRENFDADLEDLRADDPEFDAELAKITVPYLALHGQELPPGYEEWFAATLPTGVLEQWPGTGHWPQLVARERFIARIRRFVADNA